MPWLVVALGGGVEQTGCVGGGVQLVELEVGLVAGGFVVTVVGFGCVWRLRGIVPDRGGYL